MTDDAKSYTFKIRDGLTFHDGDDVTTDDLLASIARYEQRQPIGISIRQLGDPSYQKIDDVTFQMDMGKTFGLVPFFWGTWGTVYVFKEEVASETLPDVAIEAERTIGSGTFKFVSWEPGNRLVMERYENYIPRSDTKDGAAGSKEAFLDQIVMSEVPDQATRVAALLTQQAPISQKVSLVTCFRLWKTAQPLLLTPSAHGRRRGWYSITCTHPLTTNGRGSQFRQSLTERSI